MIKSTSFFTRLSRLCRLLLWLFQAMWQIRTLTQASHQQRNEIIAQLCQNALRILNIRLNVQDAHLLANETKLIVSNHVSWLDILAINAIMPSSFIAKQEIRSWFFLGKIISNAGTVFINRNDRKNTEVIVKAMNQALAQQQSICFFPEARTSDGTSVLPFKAALFQAAIDSNCPVQPIALNYLDADGKKTVQAAYIDNVSLFRSLFLILSMQEIEIRVHSIPALVSHHDRFVLKDTAEQLISSKVQEYSV